MRSSPSLWPDYGRSEYAILARRRSSWVARFGMALAVVLVAGLALKSVYSEIATGAEHGTVTDGVAGTAPDLITSGATTGVSTARQRAPQTFGFAPIGAVDRVPVDQPTDQQPAPLPASPVAPEPAVHETQPSTVQPTPGAPPAQREDRAPGTKKRYARDRERAPVEVYQLQDGRQVTVRRPSRNSSRYAEGADNSRNGSSRNGNSWNNNSWNDNSWSNGFAWSGNNNGFAWGGNSDRTRAGRHIRLARPSQFDAPF